jgi:hypothetical protein
MATVLELLDGCTIGCAATAACAPHDAVAHHSTVDKTPDLPERSGSKHLHVPTVLYLPYLRCTALLSAAVTRHPG